MAAIACFDLDGTLIAGDSLRLFVKYLLDSGHYSGRNVLRIASAFGRRKCRLITLEQAKAEVLAPLTGRTREELCDLARQFWASKLSTCVRPEMAARIHLHKSRGDRTLLVTSAPDAYLEVVRSEIGFDLAYGTELIFDRDRFTGTLGHHLFGVSKVEALRVLRVPGEAVYAYSDHHTDLPLLESSTYPCAVYPTPTLRRIAQARSWKLVGAG